MKIILALLIVTNSNAGTFKDWCRRVLVDVDPYQYETLSTSQVYRQYLTEGIDCYWKNKTSRTLFVLGNELRARIDLEPKMTDVIETYQKFEDK